MAVHAPTAEERALHWTIELLVTSQALSADARLTILAALSPRFQGGQLPDNVNARLLLDSLNIRTSSFTRLPLEVAEFVFESLITLGDIAHNKGELADGLELPEPPLHLTAMAFCETMVGTLRPSSRGSGIGEVVADFRERCDTYDLGDVKRASPWVDKRTLENLLRALKRDADSMLRGDVDPSRVLEKHHAADKLCAALAAYCKDAIAALGPAFLERVAADIGAGAYAPLVERAPKSTNGASPSAPTGILIDRARGVGDARPLRAREGFFLADDADAADAGDVDNTASEREARGDAARERGTRKRPERPLGPPEALAPRPSPPRVVALANAARRVAASDAWTHLAKHAESGGADRRSSEDGLAFDGTEDEEDASPGAEAARRRRRKLGAALRDGAGRSGGGDGATVAWDASQGDGLTTQGGTPVAVDPRRGPKTAARATPGSLGRSYRRWSSEEEANLLTLVGKHGEGKWAQMLAEGQKAGKLRASLTSVDLKDKYRNLKMARQRRESRMD